MNLARPQRARGWLQPPPAPAAGDKVATTPSAARSSGVGIPRWRDSVRNCMGEVVEYRVVMSKFPTRDHLANTKRLAPLTSGRPLLRWQTHPASACDAVIVAIKTLI